MEDGEVKILVLDRGHVLVGRVSRHPDLAFFWRVSPARVIRRWGTERGIAQLAGGPLSGTVLDDAADESVPFRAVIRILDASEEGWGSHLTSVRSPAKRSRATKES